MTRDSLTKLGALLIHVLTVTVALTLVSQMLPIKEVFEYDPDEGINLTKAHLYMNGYALFQEIWSDHPALFTALLSWWFRIFGVSVYHARLLVLGFSGMLIWSLFQLTRENDGAFCGLVACILLILSSDYAALSSSVMIGLPSIALALFSTWLLTLHRKSCQRPYLVASGAIMALALQTKLFAGVLLPAMLYEIFSIERLGPGKSEKTPRAVFGLSLWIITLVMVYVFISLAFSSVDFSLLIQPHLKGRHIGLKGDSDLYRFLTQDFELVVLASAALVLLTVKKSPRSLMPFLWLICGLLSVLVHKPIWYHHYLLISIPTCWIASLGVAQLFHRTNWIGWSTKANPIHSIALLLVAASLCLVIIKVPEKYHRIDRRLSGSGFPTAYHHTIILMQKYANQNNWIVTDRPVFAFYAKLFVPPEMAVFSWKRLVTGDLTADDIVKYIRKYRPPLILFNRFPSIEKNILPEIEKDYYLVYRNPSPPIRLYLLDESEESALEVYNDRAT